MLTDHAEWNILQYPLTEGHTGLVLSRYIGIYCEWCIRTTGLHKWCTRMKLNQLLSTLKWIAGKLVCTADTNAANWLVVHCVIKWGQNSCFYIFTWLRAGGWDRSGYCGTLLHDAVGVNWKMGETTDIKVQVPSVKANYTTWITMRA